MGAHTSNGGTVNLSGIWACTIDGESGFAYLPGTLDENYIGTPDDTPQAWHPDAVIQQETGRDNNVILTRLTRHFRYEGRAEFSKRLVTTPAPGKRRFVYVERSRMLTFEINGRAVPPFVYGSLSTPWIFEVTGLLTGDDLLTFVCDNSYDGLPGDAVRYSSAATDETQTNWNGLLGRIELQEKLPTFIHQIKVYPEQRAVRMKILVSSQAEWHGRIHIESSAFPESCTLDADIAAGLTELVTDRLPVSRDVPEWDIDAGNLIELTVTPEGLQPVKATFGLRTITVSSGRLFLNEHPVFLRGETNCAVFPETGYPPLSVDEWKHILIRYRAYGVNFVRFHSHIPPEAAFYAADQLGMLLQPELSHWDPRDAFGTTKSRSYYTQELEETLSMLVNHPSFVMLSFGNELQYSESNCRFVQDLLNHAKIMDPTRLFAGGSNVFYGAKGCDLFSDFHTSGMIYDKDLRACNSGMTGFLNNSYDHFKTYDEAVQKARKDSMQPLISFEVGQYESLPDFEQLQDYKGVTRPDNLSVMLKKAEENGIKDNWQRRVAASGELALLCYQAEAEAAMLTEGLSGLVLLSLQDFPGQGTALVGMMDSHLRPKPYAFAKPERFRSFFRECLPIPVVPRRAFYSDEVISAEIRIANHSRQRILDQVQVHLGDELQILPAVSAGVGQITSAGTVTFDLSRYTEASQLSLNIRFGGQEYGKMIWVYPRREPVCPPDVYETKQMDKTALDTLQDGGIVYLTPDSTAENLPNSIQEHFSTNFWSVGTFPEQTGGMGLLINSSHPIFTRFPTSFHTDWQWWPMACRRAVGLPPDIPAIVTQLDCPQHMRSLAMLFEGKCLNGRVLFSSMGLHQILQYPEACALQNAIYDYLVSDSFKPETILEPGMLQTLTGSVDKP